MRTIIAIILTFACCQNSWAASDWQTFDVSVARRQTNRIGTTTVTIQTREAPNAYFAEDFLILVCSVPGKPETRYVFESSYGMGAVAIHDGLVFLKYGVGRGTAVREEHIKIFSLAHSYLELADIKTSYWLYRKGYGPDLVEYDLTYARTRGYARITLRAPAHNGELPTEKSFMVKLH